MVILPHSLLYLPTYSFLSVCSHHPFLFLNFPLLSPSLSHSLLCLALIISPKRLSNVLLPLTHVISTHLPLLLPSPPLFFMPSYQLISPPHSATLTLPSLFSDNLALALTISPLRLTCPLSPVPLPSLPSLPSNFPPSFLQAQVLVAARGITARNPISLRMGNAFCFAGPECHLCSHSHLGLLRTWPSIQHA